MQLTKVLQYVSIDDIFISISIVAAFICIGDFVLKNSLILRTWKGIKVRCITRLLLIKNKILSSRKRVYIYTDCGKSSNITRGIVDELQKQSQYHILSVENPEDLQQLPLHPNITQAVIIIITNVSRLSSNEKTREKIQNDLLEFARNGGILIFGHDVLWHRTKNKKFMEAMFKLTKYERRDKKKEQSIISTIENSDGLVSYEKNPNIKNSRLPKEFSWRDNEVIAVDEWDKIIIENNLIPIYVEKETRSVLVAKKNLVAKRNSVNGCIFWINSGDHTVKDPPGSLRIHDGFTIAHLLKYLTENEDLELKSEARSKNHPFQ